jgi:hypothetical protein
MGLPVRGQRTRSQVCLDMRWSGIQSDANHVVDLDSAETE